MSILNSGIVPVGSTDDNYTIEKSLRFNDGSTPYLSRTPSSVGNEKTWTWSCWVKRTVTGVATQTMFSQGTAGARNNIAFLHTGQFRAEFNPTGSTWYALVSTPVFRDPSAWYHVVLSMDTTQSVAKERTKIWINNVRITDFASESYLPQNTDTNFNTTDMQKIGAYWTGTSNHSGYLADVHFLDGHAVNPDTFGEFNTYGQWVAKTPTFANPSFDDGSDSNHKVELNGNVQTTVGKYGQGFAFDGSGDFLDMDYSSDFDFGTSDFTIEAWTKFNVSGNQTALVSTAFHNNSFHMMLNTDNKLRFSGSNPDGSIIGTSDVTDGEWHHLALVRASNVIYIFVDGILENSGAWTTSLTPATATRLTIGEEAYTGRRIPFNGSMDDIRISNTARYTADFTPPTERLESDANTKLLLNGDQVTIAEGKFSDGMEFDGTNDYIKTATSLSLGTSSMSFSFWCKPLSSGDPLSAHLTEDRHLSFYRYSDNSHVFNVGSGSAWGSGARSAPNSAPLGVWNHIVGVVSSVGNTEIFINGVSMATGQAASGYNFNDILVIGHRISQGAGSGYGFEGTVKEVSVYSSALSSSDITSLYNKGVPKPATEVQSASLEAYYPLNETNGSSVFDNSTNSNHGTVHGAAPSTYGQNGFHLDFNPVDPDALYFSGTGNTHVHPPSGFTSVLKVQNQGSFSGWFKIEVGGYISPFFVLIGNGTTSGYVGLGLNGDILRFVNGFTHATVPQRGGGNFADNTWHHAVYATDGTTFDIYLDGVKCEIDSSGANHDKWFNNHVGGSDTFFGKLDRGYQSHRMTGNIKDFAFYSNKLTQANVETLYNDGNTADATTVSGSNLVGYWKMGDGSGTTVADSSGNSYTADLVNTSWTVANVGNDKNGNNNFTLNNLGIEDQVLDTPSNNFATFNPLTAVSSVIYSEGNLKIVSNNHITQPSSIGIQSGKWYAEYYCVSGTYTRLGISNQDGIGQGLGEHAGTWSKISDPSRTYTGGAVTAYGTDWDATEIGMIAFDADSGKVWYGSNGTWDASGNPSTASNPSQSSITGDEFFIAVSSGASTLTYVANFGQDSSFAGNKTAQGNADDNGYGDFYYAPPTGFLALCTQNLPEPTVVPSEHFNTVIHTGTGSTQSITGVGFAPDFRWTKSRANTYAHLLHDNIRGETKYLQSNTVNAEATLANLSLDSDGFTVHADDNGSTEVSWLWKANGSGSSNTVGDINSTVSANVDAGFSIVSYTGNDNGTTNTIGHGLSQAPELVFSKRRNTGGYHWMTGYNIDGTDHSLYLNSSYAADNELTRSPQAFTATTFRPCSIGSNPHSNGIEPYIAYCFHSVEGYSKVGSYTGNGSTDGTFVHCGFRPAYVMIKRTDAANNWIILDSIRDTFNDVEKQLLPNVADSEYTVPNTLDLTSNGFKLRDTNSSRNASGGTYIYLAFAESDFKHSNAR